MTMQWDTRLITPARAMALAGNHPIYPDTTEPATLRYRCGQCMQSIGTWTAVALTSAEDILAAVLRHLVMAHDVALNNPEVTSDRTITVDTAGQPQGAAAPGHGGRPGRVLGYLAVRRSRHQT